MSFRNDTQLEYASISRVELHLSHLPISYVSFLLVDYIIECISSHSMITFFVFVAFGTQWVTNVYCSWSYWHVRMMSHLVTDCSPVLLSYYWWLVVHSEYFVIPEWLRWICLLARNRFVCLLICSLAFYLIVILSTRRLHNRVHFIPFNDYLLRLRSVWYSVSYKRILFLIVLTCSYDVSFGYRL